MIEKKSWEEFRKTGLFLVVNQLLHVFGWALVIETHEDKSISIFPARVKFRGFDEKSTSSAHKMIGQYMKDNIEEIYKESQE